MKFDVFMEVTKSENIKASEFTDMKGKWLKLQLVVIVS